MSQNKSRKLFNQTSNQKNPDEKVSWLEKNLAEVLNAYAKIFKVIFSKQW